MTSLNALAEAIADAPQLEAAVGILVEGLAERIKATSNDQNIQRLARDLKQHAPDLIEALAGKERASAGQLPS